MAWHNQRGIWRPEPLLWQQPTGIGPAAEGAPVPAAAAGYDELIFSDEFDSSSTIAPTRSGSGFKWWPGPNGTPTYTVAGSELRMTSDISPNSGGLISILDPGSSPGPNIFRRCYFEARMKFNPSSFSGTNGWPAFWSLDANWPNLSTFTELDFMEGIPVPRTAGQPAALFQAIHEWSTNFASETANNVGTNQPTLPGGTDFNEYHTYGCLWAPNLITWYFDNAPFVTQAIAAGSGYSLDTSLDARLYLVIGTGTSWLCTWDWVRVWG